MTKKLVTGIVAVLLVIALAVPAFAAITDVQKEEINGLYQQIAELRKQIVQKYIDAGEVTKEQGDLIQKNIDEATKYQQENGGAFGPGWGCGGGGMMGGYGGGGMMNGYGGGYGMMGGQTI